MPPDLVLLLAFSMKNLDGLGKLFWETFIFGPTMALYHNARKIFFHLDLDKLEVTQYRIVSSVSDVLHFHFHLCTCQNAICIVLYITEWFVEFCCFLHLVT